MNRIHFCLFNYLEPQNANEHRLKKARLIVPLLLSLAGAYQAKAQQLPGGVATSAWYRADIPASLFSDAGTTTATNNTTIQRWHEATGNNFELSQASATSRPRFSNISVLANFNPTVTFDGSNDWMQFTAATGINMIDRANGTLVAAGKVNTLKRGGFLGFHPTMDYPGLHIASDNQLLFYTGGPAYQGRSTNVFATNTFFSAASGWQNGAGTTSAYAAATVSVNGIRAEYTGSQLYNANLSNGARDLRIGADSNFGSFSGQINEILVFEEKLTAEQLDRVETYLAIKYGTTYAAGSRDYKSATGTVIWSATANHGWHHNLAGIGNESALNQKQSWSTNAGNQVLISTVALANTNADNTNTLANGQYLIWGDNGLAKVPIVATSAFASVSHQFEAVWKIQNTGAVGTVRVSWPKALKNLSLIQSTDPTISSDDLLTPMTAEITINDIVYNYADVTLADGAYFTFAAKVPAPGGVSTGLTHWYRADEGIVSVGGDGTNVTTWTDFARGTISSKIATAPVPLFKKGATNHFNFNPGLHFTTNRQMLGNLASQTLENTSFDIFTVTKEGMTGSRFFNVGMNNTAFNGANWDQPGLYASGNVGTRNRTGGGAGIANPGNIAFSTAIPSIMYHTFTNTSIRKGVNGANLGSSWAISARGQMAGGHIFGSNAGTSPPGGDDWGFLGHIGEVIIYGAANLSVAERSRVDTYLAIKYGITLPNSVNYLNSSGAIVWNSSANSGYQNNIAGIVLDEESALNQKQSISVNKGQQVIISTTGLANSNVENGTSLSDGQYLIWGDNGLAKTLSTAFNFPSVPTLNLRFAAIWKVQNSGNTGTVRIAWPSGTPSLTLLQSTDATFDDSDTRTDMSSNLIVVNGIPYNYADVTLGDGEYFTFAGFIVGPGGVGTDLSLWYKADNGVATNGSSLVTEWATTTTKAVNLTPNSTAALRYNDQTTYSRTWNFNPTVSFTGSTNYLRNNTTDYLTSAGSVHYIAVARNPARSTAARALFSIAGNDDGFFYSGGSANTAFPTIGNNFNPVSAAIPTPNNYGIYSSILPKTGSPVNQRGFYNGLKKVYSSPYPYTGGNYSLPTRGAYMGSDGTSGDIFNGDIAEIVLYHSTTGGDMLDEDLSKIHSYLALKYGITLDQTLPQNYVNSSGSTVWDAATINVGYNHHIAGIGRDDAGSLNQKQSRSVNSGTQVLISTTGLTNTNANNTSGFVNGQFLIWGDNGLVKAPTVSVVGITDVNYRFASIWKVQNTNGIGTIRIAWPKGYANLKLIQSIDDVIDASDIITDMNDEQLINDVAYAYADVTLTDGQYFTFAAFVQGPGGVTNHLSYWYRADKFTEAASVAGEVNSWTDFTSGTISAQIGDNDLPTLTEGTATYFNYNPGINFTTVNQTLANIHVETVTALDYDIFTLTKEGVTQGPNGRIFSSLVNNANLSGNINYWDGIGLMANGQVERMNTSFSNRYLANPGNINYSSNSPSIMYTKFSETSVSKGLNGAANGNAGISTSIGQFSGGHAFGSTQFSSNGSDNAGFTGHIGELIIYGSGSVTDTDRNKVDSYLAIKYGVTLSNANDYTTSSGAIVWHADPGGSFYNNVAGIGHDFTSALLQKQSRSQHSNTNNQVIIGLGEIAETNASNPNTLPDGQFLVWGDNGNTQAMINNNTSTYTVFNFAGGTANGRRMNRIWKVQNSNMTDEVLLRFPVSSVGTTTFPAGIEPCAQYVLLTASDAAFTTDVAATPLVVNETYYDLLARFPNDISYFTFAKLTPINIGTAYLPFSVENTADYNNNCGAGEWKYYYQANDNTQNLFAAAGFDESDLNNLTVTITPEGTTYDDGTRSTNLMPRITTVTDAGPFNSSVNKVRVYYSLDELNQTIVTGSSSASGWFKYDGDAEEAIIDIYSDGLMNPTKALPLIPDAFGVEDGVNYVEFHNISSFSSFIYLSTTEQSALPVTLSHFHVSENEKSVALTWQTANEQSSKIFGIERSPDAKSWMSIGQVVASGESSSELSYRFTDTTPLSGVNYYRLKMIDQNNTYTYSSIRSVRIEGLPNVFIYPNPATSKLMFQNLPPQAVDKVLIYDNLGRLQGEVNHQLHQGISVASLPSGIYIVVVKMVDGSIGRHKITVQK